MSKTLRLQCLFCNHRNVVSAKFCNECASPLHLQPCNQCGAIDNRTASTCYKCGAQFKVPAPKRARGSAAPKPESAPAASEPADEPAAPVPESVPAPPIPEDQIAKPIQNAGAFSIERAFLSKSPAQIGGMFRQGGRREVTETQDQVASVADLDPIHLNPDPAHSAVEPQSMDTAVASEGVHYPVLALSAVEPQPMDDTVESERGVTATGTRRARHLALLVSLLAATAALGYYYYDRSAQQIAQEQSAGQSAPGTPDGPVAIGATTATVPTQLDATSAPKDVTSQPTTSAVEIEKALPPAARVVAKPRTDPEPVPANRLLDDPASVSRPAATPQAAAAASSTRRPSVIDADVTSRRDPPIFKECTEAVAALGLCSPGR